MANINNSLENMKKTLDASKLADDTAQMTKDLNKVARDTNTLNGQVNDLLAVLLQQKLQGSVSGGDASVFGGNAGAGGNGGSVASDAAIEALKAMQKELDMMNTVVGSVLEATDEQAAEKAKVNVNNAMNNLKSVIDSCENNVSNMQGIYKNNLVPQMQRVLTLSLIHI